MSDRPADSIVKLADYLWWLLPTFLKTKVRAGSLVARFAEIWGEHLDAARETLIVIIPELLAATTGRSQAAEEVVTSEDVFDHVVTKVYVLEAEALDPVLESKLRAGAIFRIPYRPRLGHMENPAFLLANEHGIFLVHAELCDFDYVGLTQTIAETDDAWEEAATDGDEFGFELDWEADHAVA